MDTHKPLQAPVCRPGELVRALKNRFSYLWMVSDDFEPWELRFLFQLVEHDDGLFKINIAMIANRNGLAEDVQHVAYLELISDGDALSLCWSEGVNHCFEKTLAAFKATYPLQQLISDIQAALESCGVARVMPEFEVPEVAVKCA